MDSDERGGLKPVEEGLDAAAQTVRAEVFAAAHLDTNHQLFFKFKSVPALAAAREMLLQLALRDLVQIPVQELIELFQGFPAVHGRAPPCALTTPDSTACSQ